MGTIDHDSRTPSSAVDVIAEACSHQLGEAVAIIGGYVGVLRESGTSEASTLRAVDGGVERVRRVVEDLLDLTRVAGRSAPHERVALEPLLLRAVDELGGDAQTLEVRSGPLPDVIGDAEQLVCALRQVLRSAAAARGPGQDHVLVMLTASEPVDGRVWLALEDDADAPPGLIGGLARGRGPLVGAGAADLIVNRVAAAHGGTRIGAMNDGHRVGFDLPVAS